jgi:hypothetical protein
MISRRVWRGSVYLSLALIYVVLGVALCLRAPLVQRPVQLTADDVDLESNPNQAPRSLHWDDENIVARAPLWRIGDQFSLNLSLFVIEQAEVFGFVLIAVLAYRFRMRLAMEGARLGAFIASRRRGACVWLGFAVLLAMTLFPPWVKINTFGGRIPTQRSNLWHAPIFRPPIVATRFESSEVDYARMLIEITTGESFVLALYLTWPRRKPTSGSERRYSTDRPPAF